MSDERISDATVPEQADFDDRAIGSSNRHTANGRSSLLPALGVALAAALLGSMFLPWGVARANFDATVIPEFLRSTLPDQVFNAWQMHDVWDIAIAIAAVAMLVANLALLIAPKTRPLVAIAIANFASAFALVGVIATLVSPPVPALVDTINAMDNSFIPKIEIAARYGLFVSLALAAILLIVSMSQSFRARRDRLREAASSLQPPAQQRHGSDPAP